MSLLVVAPTRSAIDVHLGQDPTQQLARGVVWQLVDEHHIPGDLVARQVVLDVELDLLSVLRGTGLRNNEGAQPLSELVVVDTHHRRIEDIVTLDKQILDLLRKDVLATGNDHVVIAPVDEKQSVPVEVAHVAAGHVTVDDLLVPAIGVTLEWRRVADEDPTLLVGAIDTTSLSS